MKEQIFLLNKDKTLMELNESGFVTEAEFQDLLEHYPGLIPGGQITEDDPRKWLLISREFGVPGEESGSNKWSLDHLFLDQDAIPTLVEVKRSTDTRIRREVVGQMLDYAANAVTYWSVHVIREKFQDSCTKSNSDPEWKLAEFLGADIDPEKFWSQVDSNLKAGKIRMLFIADRIPTELQRIIEFLNEQMSPAEVLGVEIKKFGNDSVKTLVPRVIGQTSSARIVKGPNADRHWTEESFLEELTRKHGKDIALLAKALLDRFRKSVSYMWMGRGATYGSIVPVLKVRNSEYFPFALWTYGKIEIYFQYYLSKPPFDQEDMRLDLLRRLNKIPGVNIPESKIDKRPSFDLKLLADPAAFESFVNTYQWFLKQFKG